MIFWFVFGTMYYYYQGKSVGKGEIEGRKSKSSFAVHF
jgi:hypothetical protein